MANDQGLGLGLYPIRQPFGAMPIAYYRANTAQNIFRYQPMTVNNSGQAEVAAIGDLNTMVGTCMGFLDLNEASLPSGITTLTQAAYLPSGTDAYVAITVDPNQQYMMEADTGGSANVAFTQIGNTCGFTYSGTTGNTTTGISNALLDASDAAADSGGTLRIINLADNVNRDGTINTSSANFCKVIVKIDKSAFGPTTLATGF